MSGERVIVIDPEIMSGMPCFRGTRVLFKNLIDYLEGGYPLGRFLRQFPTITREMAIQSLEEAKDSLLAKIASRSFRMSACRSPSGAAFPNTMFTRQSGRD
jgi:uncharacterized protein (DUF433 family)